MLRVSHQTIVPISVRHPGHKSPLRPINTYCYPVRGFFGHRSNKANLESNSGRSLNPTPQNCIPNQLQGFQPPSMLDQWSSPLPLRRRDLRLVSPKFICITSQNNALHCIAKCPLPAFFSICAFISPTDLVSSCPSFEGPPRSDLYCKLFHEGFNIHVVGFGIGIDFPAATHGIMSELVLAFALLSPAAT